MKTSLLIGAALVGLLLTQTPAIAASEKATKPAAKQTQPAKQAAATLPKSTKVNVNKATVKELQQLKGIGAKKAQAIVEYRNSKGKFKNAQQLLQVSGIGEKLIAQNKANMVF